MLYLNYVSTEKKSRTCHWEVGLGQEFEESFGIKKGTVGVEVVNDSVEALRSHGKGVWISLSGQRGRFS